MTYILPVLYVIVSYTFFFWQFHFWQCNHIADSIDPSALYYGDRQFDCCADRRKKVV